MSRFESITIREVESSDLESFYEHQLATRKRLGWQHSSVKTPRTRQPSTPIGTKFCIHHKTQRGRSLQRDKSLVTYRAIRTEKTWKSPIGFGGSSGEGD